MDSENNFLVELRKSLSSVDEEYLVSISNKGTYKRALKDMENDLIQEMKMEQELVRILLKDGIECIITPDLNNIKCSCPSRSVCKHIVVALIYAKNTIVSEIKEKKNGDFHEILEVDLEKVKKVIGEKSFREILYRIQYGIVPKIYEEEFLTVKFDEEEIYIRFSENNTIDQAICSCKDKGMCIHKAEAILNYKILKGIISIDEIIKNSKNKIDFEILEEIKICIENIFSIGLSRLPRDIEDRIQPLTLKCQSIGLFNLQKMLRTLSAELELYFTRNATFSRKTTLRLCSKIYNLCITMTNLDIDQSSSLIGEQRSTYFNVPPVNLQYIACESWVTKSGYEGLTIYFWDSNKEKWFTYTRAQANYYDNNTFNSKTAYYSKLPWDTKMTFRDLEGKLFRFYNLKINKNGRMTSSDKVKLIEQPFEELTINKVTRFDIIKNGLLTNNDNIYFKEEEPLNLFIVKPEEILDSSFDKINQVLDLPILDREGQRLILTVKFSTKNKKAVEKLEKGNLNVDSFFIRAYIEKGELHGFPISIFYTDKEVYNLTLD